MVVAADGTGSTRTPASTRALCFEQRDADTGALLAEIPDGRDVSALAHGYGSLWLFDGVRHTVRRVQV